MNPTNWDTRIDAWYAADFDESRPAQSIASMRALVGRHPDVGALATFELAGVYDSLGLEAEAVPFYRQALDDGLDQAHAARARIQLASTLRNLGRIDEAIDLLSQPGGAETDGLKEGASRADASRADASRRAFLALALHSAGRHDEALREALEALIPTLPRYQRSLSGYAAELTAKD